MLFVSVAYRNDLARGGASDLVRGVLSNEDGFLCGDRERSHRDVVSIGDGHQNIAGLKIVDAKQLGAIKSHGRGDGLLCAENCKDWRDHGRKVAERSYLSESFLLILP